MCIFQTEKDGTNICTSQGLFYGLFMAALRSRCGHYIFALWFLFLLLSFLPRLISAVTDKMSAILPHMVWP